MRLISNKNRVQRTIIWTIGLLLVASFIWLGFFYYNSKKNYEGDMMFCAAGSGNDIILRVLIAHKADDVKTKRGGFSLLHYARNAKKVDILVDNGIAVDNFGPTEENKETPLLQAAFDGRNSAAQELIRKGANINIGTRHPDKLKTDYTDKPISSPLSTAAMFGHYDVAETLVKAGADLNAMVNESSGNRPLHDAVIGNKLKIVQLLVEHGAAVNMRNISGVTPLGLAKARNQNPDIIKYLENHGGTL